MYIWREIFDCNGKDDLSKFLSHAIPRIKKSVQHSRLMNLNSGKEEHIGKSWSGMSEAQILTYIGSQLSKPSCGDN
jgi:thiamine phosphate synthase YjbQ (UPF0047 family)